MTNSKRYLISFLILLGAFIILDSHVTAKRPAQENIYQIGTIHYIAPDGDDAHPGTLAAPFRTVQRCADVAVAGTACTLRAGVYRETVTPAHSGTPSNPITFRSYPGEIAILSGADIVTSWTHIASDRYTAALDWDFNTRHSGDSDHQVSNDQLFFDGLMLPEARWPNIPYDRATRTTNGDMAQADDAALTDETHATYYDADLAAIPAGTFDGTQITFAPGYKLVHGTCDVTQQTTAAVSLACNPDPGAWGHNATLGGAYRMPSPGNYYYLWGTLDALDAPGEWFHAADGTLTLLSPDGSDPAVHLVEARRRAWVLDLRGREHIVVDGLHFFAGAIQYDDDTHHTTIQNIEMRYPWHVQELLPFYYTGGTQALRVRGTYNVISDSLLAHSPAAMFRLDGAHNRVANNVIREAGYMGSGAAVSRSSDALASSIVTQNTIFDVGSVAVGADPGLDITYNDLYRSHLLISDLGTIYGWGSDGHDAVIAYNLVHDNNGERNPDLDYWGGHGIYLDDDTYNYRIYRNVVWDTTSPGIFVYGTNGTVVTDYDAGAASNRSIYNNTVLGTMSASAKSDYDGLPQTLTGTTFVNNIATIVGLDDPNLTTSHNYEGDGLYVGTDHHDYRLLPYSPAGDAGDVIPGVTDGHVGAAPDLGALERGIAPFVAGAVLRARDLDGLNVACVQTAAGDAECALTGLPLGRKLPADFQVGLGDGMLTLPDTCLTHMDYDANRGAGVCAGLPTGGLSGVQPVYIRMGGGDWRDAGTTINLGDLALFDVAPDHGLTNGGAQVTLAGRRFDTSPAGYAVPITLTNTGAATLYAYPTPITLDTAALIAAGKLRSDCDDLRFRDADSDLAYWIESGCGAVDTRVWVQAAYIPIGSSVITATFGNSDLASQSNGDAVFTFFDDFEDSVLNDERWDIWDDAGSWYAVEETGGAMRVSGATDDSTKYSSGGFSLMTWKLHLPPQVAVDVELTLVQSPDNFKATLGTWDLGIYSGGDGKPKKIGYYVDGSGWQQVGSSTITNAQLARQRFSMGYAGSADNWTIRWLENGDLADVRAERAVDDVSIGGFGYSPDAVTSFDARFDNVRLRPYTFPEPTAGAGAVYTTGVQIQFCDTHGDCQPCRNAQLAGPEQATCVAPPHPPGTVDIVIINPNGTQATLPDGYTYVETHSIYLPLVLRGNN